MLAHAQTPIAGTIPARAQPKHNASAHRKPLHAPSIVSWFAMMGALSSLAIAGTATSQQTLNSTQVQGVDVSSTQTLNVVENYGLLQTDTSATGNSLIMGNQRVDASLHATQTMNANIDAVVDINGTNTGDGHLSLGTPVFVTTQGMANYVGVAASEGGTADSHIIQNANGTHVYATANINSPNNAIYQSGEVQSVTVVNQAQFSSDNARLTGSVDQTSDSHSRAIASATIYYSPSDVLFGATATGNYVSSNGKGASSVELTTHQVSNGTTQARSEIFGGNMWSVATTANAAGNVVDLGNEGGSLVSINNQTNNGYVLSQSDLHADEFGTASSQAVGAGNSFYGGNNDIYTDVDNTQLNTGIHGIEVTANFSGGTGYDANVTADATGNMATAFSCATCGGILTVGNHQDNETGVSATTNVNITNQSRSIVSTARAVGNSGVFYTSNGH